MSRPVGRNCVRSAASSSSTGRGQGGRRAALEALSPPQPDRASRSGRAEKLSTRRERRRTAPEGVERMDGIRAVIRGSALCRAPEGGQMGSGRAVGILRNKQDDDNRPAPDSTMLRVLLAGPRGFCAGVDRAIRVVQEALRRFGAPVYVRHEIVHNATVVESLRNQGAVYVED